MISIRHFSTVVSRLLLLECEMPTAADPSDGKNPHKLRYFFMKQNIRGEIWRNECPSMPQMLPARERKW
jgi:hypothetical protein